MSFGGSVTSSPHALNLAPVAILAAMNQAAVSGLKAALLDLDGVLYVGEKSIPDAAITVSRLRDQGLTLAGVTNTTTQSRRMVAEKLARLGIPLTEASLHTPAALARRRIGDGSAALFVRDALREDLRSIHETFDQPDYVVMGDIGGEGYTAEMLRQIFTMVMDGAKILALHKNRFWQKPDGLHLDIGPFVAAIEYATNCQATVLGKPSHDFFTSVCEAIAIPAGQCLMVGDDVESDIGGAAASGLRTVLVKTGKYREAFVKRSGIKADLVISSIADLPDAINLLRG